MEIQRLEKKISLYEEQIEQLDIEIDKINEEIEMLEEQKAAYEDQKKALEEQKVAIEEYYDQLIESTEAAFDEILDGLNATLEKWQQLSELESIASAWKDVGGVMEMFGYTVEDVLNDTPGAFEKFKEAYIGVLMDVNNGNADFIAGVQEWSNQTGQSVDGALSKWNTFGDGMNNALNGASSSLSDATQAITNLQDPLNTLATAVDNVQKALEGGFQFEIDENGLAIIEAVPDKLRDMATSVEDASKSIPQGVVDALQNDETAIAEAEEFGKKVVGRDGGEKKGTGYSKGIAEGSPSETTIDATKAIPEGVVKALETDETAEPAAEKFGKDVVDSVAKGMTDNITAPTTAMQTLCDALIAVMDELLAKTNEFAGADATSPLVEALEQLNAMSLQEGIIAQFTALKDAVDAVVASVGSGVAGAEQSQGGDSGQGSDAGGATGSLTSAIQAVKTTADEAIGTEAEAEEGAIGDFNALKTSVEGVTAAIGGGDSEGGSGGSSGQGGGEGEGDGTLVSALELAKETADETVGVDPDEEEETMIGDFNALKTSVKNVMETIGTEDGEGGEAEEGTLVSNLRGLYEVGYEVLAGDEGLIALFGELCDTIVAASEAVYDLATGIKEAGTNAGMSVSGGSSLALPKFSQYRYKGTALASGSWNVGHNEKALTGELGQETVIRDGKYFTVGDNGPEFVNLKKNDIVLNHLQTKEIFDKKNHVKSLHGRSFAAGSLPNGITPLSQLDPDYYATLVDFGETLMENIGFVRNDIGDIAKTTQSIERTMQVVNNNRSENTVVNVGDVIIQSHGITKQEVAEEVAYGLQREFAGMALHAYQKSTKN